MQFFFKFLLSIFTEFIFSTNAFEIPCSLKNILFNITWSWKVSCGCNLFHSIIFSLWLSETFILGNFLLIYQSMAFQFISTEFSWVRWNIVVKNDFNCPSVRRSSLLFGNQGISTKYQLPYNVIWKFFCVPLVVDILSKTQCSFFSTNWSIHYCARKVRFLGNTMFFLQNFLCCLDGLYEFFNACCLNFPCLSKSLPACIDAACNSSFLRLGQPDVRQKSSKFRGFLSYVRLP